MRAQWTEYASPCIAYLTGHLSALGIVFSIIMREEVGGSSALGSILAQIGLVQSSPVFIIPPFSEQPPFAFL